MRPLWMTRLVRVVRPPKCLACGCSTEGGLYCDVCGHRLMEATRDRLLTDSGPRPV